MCALFAAAAAVQTVRVAKRTSVGVRRAVAWVVALAVPAELACAERAPSGARTAAVVAGVLGAAAYAWITSPTRRR